VGEENERGESAEAMWRGELAEASLA